MLGCFAAYYFVIFYVRYAWYSKLLWAASEVLVELHDFNLMFFEWLDIVTKA